MIDIELVVTKFQKIIRRKIIDRQWQYLSFSGPFLIKKSISASAKSRYHTFSYGNLHSKQVLAFLILPGKWEAESKDHKGRDTQ